MAHKARLNKEQLHTMLVEQGFEHQVFQKDNNELSLFDGDLSFDQISEGVSMHCSDGIEKQRAHSSASIAPCISINIVFTGNVGFSLGEDRYQFDVSNKPILFINVIGQQEVFTRHLIENQTVKKVNVTIEKDWLLKRCKSSVDVEIMASIFDHNCLVYGFDCSSLLIKLAESLFKQKVNSEIGSHLKAEHLSLQILHSCLPLLSNHSDENIVSPNRLNLSSKLSVNPKSPIGVSKIEIALNDLLLKNRLLNNLSLKDVATQLGLSISTLQRKIKEKHHVTVIEYLRNKRLDNAKKLLIIERKSIGEVSFISGYSHAANFTTAFKKRFGMTPDKLRKEHLS